MLISKKGIMCIVPDGLSEDYFSVVTTKYSGYSKGYFGSNNMALHVDDDYKDVLRNQENFKQQFGIEKLVTLSQVHGGDVVRVTNENCADVMFSEADGLFTTEKGIALGILTADCYNLQLIGKKAVANLHCGWKSIVVGIVKNCLDMFESVDDYPVQAVLGPGICGECYEVGEEVSEMFEHLFPGGVFVHGENRNTHLSLRISLEKYLESMNIKDIIHIHECSSCSDLLYSYRRDEGETGRMLSVIMKK